VIEQRSDGGYDQTAGRLKYIKHLRAEHRRSPRAEADAAYLAAKTETLQMRSMEKRRELVRQSDVDKLVDCLCGVVLTHLSSNAGALCAPWRSCGPAQHRAGRVRGAHRDGQGLPGDG
jgi:hypothetical protein